MYLVYAIFNPENQKIYIGQTKDLEKRLELHNKKTFKNSYTSRFDGRWYLVYKECLKTKREVLTREKQLKSCKGREFIKSKINYSAVAQW